MSRKSLEDLKKMFIETENQPQPVKEILARFDVGKIIKNESQMERIHHAYCRHSENSDPWFALISALEETFDKPLVAGNTGKEQAFLAPIEDSAGSEKEPNPIETEDEITVESMKDMLDRILAIFLYGAETREESCLAEAFAKTAISMLSAAAGMPDDDTIQSGTGSPLSLAADLKSYIIRQERDKMLENDARRWFREWDASTSSGYVPSKTDLNEIAQEFVRTKTPYIADETSWLNAVRTWMIENGHFEPDAHNL